MYRLKHAERLMWLQIRAWPSTPTFWLGLMLGLSFALSTCFGLVRMSLAMHEPLQMFEPFIFIGSTFRQCETVTLGLILMLSDAPFMYDHIAFIGLRVERRTWMAVQFCYVLIATIVFYIVILLFSMIVSMGTAYTGNLWSSLIFDTKVGSQYAQEFGLYFSNMQFLDRFTPYQALGVAFSFQVMYGLTLGLVIFTFNLLLKRGAGLALAVLIHLLGLAILSDGPFFANQFLSLMVHGLPTYHNLFDTEPRLPLLWHSVAPFICINLALCTACMIKSRSLDYLVPYRNI